MAAALGVSTMSYLPFLWFNFLVIIISVIYGFTNKFIWYTDSKPVVPESIEEIDEQVIVDLKLS